MLRIFLGACGIALVSGLAFLASRGGDSPPGRAAGTPPKTRSAASGPYVFGEALFLGRAGAFSFARMAPEFPDAPRPAKERTAEERALVLLRCLKVVTHEVGHMFSMEHCTHGACVMNGTNSLPEMDGSALFLCSECLHKVQHATRLDVADRYRRLGEFLRREGLASQERWVARRLRIVLGS